MNVRPIQPEDYEAVVGLLVEDEELLLGRPSQIGVGDLREWLSRTNLAEDSWQLEDEDGTLCAVGWTDVPGEVALGIGVVRPGWKGRGLGAQLVERSESCGRRRGARRMHQIAFGADDAARELMLARGYREIRRFYEMAIQNEQLPPAPAVPVETFREEDAAAFFAALEESFQDHWEHHPSPFDEWWNRHRSNPAFDPSLWFLIRDGDEIAAIARSEANRNGGGYVGALGVRRPWRGKGYAKALLLHTFREFYKRGMPRVTLGVDAESPTGATHLYERVGMHVEQENVVFEKALA